MVKIHALLLSKRLKTNTHRGEIGIKNARTGILLLLFVIDTTWSELRKNDHQLYAKSKYNRQRNIKLK